MLNREVKFVYENFTLEFLFKEEEDLIAKISPYCDSTDKVIESQYYLSTTSPLFFIMEIKITQQ